VVLRATIRAELRPTEDSARVERAIRNMFGEITLSLDEEGRALTASLEGLDGMRELRGRIAQDRIRDTLRVVLTRWTRGDELSFGLSRQAAYAGHVSLNLEGADPMGPIQVSVVGDVEGLVRFLTDK
jgi:predicted RNA binding protein with dsRBD fold (UPF0201 family)